MIRGSFWKRVSLQDIEKNRDTQYNDKTKEEGSDSEPEKQTQKANNSREKQISVREATGGKSALEIQS